MNERPEFDTDLFRKGLEVRKSVLGEAAVSRSLSGVDDFTAPMQQYATEVCWGMTWTRPGLERKTRSLLNLAMLTALNRMHELRLHVRGAITNGATKEEIREVFYQTSVYCGLPAALESTRVAAEVFADMEREKATAGAR
jgi:4-carboxymuconolactone decarboxylase